MGDKRVLPSFQTVGGTNAKSVSGTMTGTSVITSQPSDIRYSDNVGLQISWTGTAVGVIEIQCSIDGVTYYPLTFGPPIAQPAGVAGGYLVNLNQVPFPYIRTVYTNASGTGALSVFICAKDLN